MVNSNPETASTDYDTSDLLFFEPLTFEDVMRVIRGIAARGKIRGLSCNSAARLPSSPTSLPARTALQRLPAQAQASAARRGDRDRRYG